MKFNLSLRLKVTLINTIVLILCSAILTIGTSISATRSIDSLSGSTASELNPTLDENNMLEYANAVEAKPTTEAVSTAKENIVMTSTFYMIVVIILGCIITYLTTKKSLESVKNLSDEIKDISEHNLSKKIKEEGANDEIKGLTKSFNNMLARIEDAFESQKQFSSNVAHELRTPLAVIQMKIDVFKKRREHTIEDYKKLIEIVEKNNNRLSKVVDELLSISNKDEIERSDKIEFSKIVKSIIHELREVAFNKNIDISVVEDIDNTNKDFYGNEQLLYRSFYNLIENSIKYNNENGYVKISLKEDNNFMNIDIEDSGIGIKKEDYENIFKPFYRVDKSRSRKIGGSGLGLSIVNTVIEQHNGDITVKSNKLGSKFTIKIPYK